MSQVLKSQETIITLIITDSAGAFVTGLAPADVTLHFRKAGGIVTAKALDAENFVEIDATEMPGLYEVTFSSSELDTLGEFVAILKQGGATEFDNQTVRLEVVDTSTDLLSENVTSLFTSLDTTTSHIKQGEAYSLPIKLDTTGLLPADVTVTALKGDGTTATITLDGTNWEEVAGLTAVYRLTLPVGMTDTLGELVYEQ